MKLDELIEIANRGYPDDEIVSYHRGETETGDGLAKFIAVELRETFDPKTADAAQIAEAIRALSVARNEIESVIEALANAGS